MIGLKYIRKKANITQQKLAEEIGVSRSAISMWETDICQPDYDTMIRLADYFGVTTDELLGLNPNRYDDIPPSSLNIETSDIHMVPVFDSVSAGFGAYASDYIVDYAPAIIKAGAEDYIYINVKGDSMFPKIEEGDRILVRRQTSVDSGSIAVVLIDGEEGVVKKVTYGDDWIELHSINPMYPIRRFEGKEVLRLEILGLVKQIVKDV